MHSCVKLHGLPLADLLEFLLQRPVIMEVMEDNTCAIGAAKEGYSPKLRHLQRKRRISLSWLAEVFEDPRHKLSYTASERQKGDLMTKDFEKSKFVQAKELVGLGAVVLKGHPCNMRSYTIEAGVARVTPATVVIEAGKDICNPGIDSWVVDTGSGNHLIPRQSMTPEEMDLETLGAPQRLATANGTITSKAITTIDTCLGLDFTDARILEKTPRVISVDKLVTLGGEFHWTAEGAFITIKKKTWKLEIQHGVPLLPLGCSFDD